MARGVQTVQTIFCLLTIIFAFLLLAQATTASPYVFAGPSLLTIESCTATTFTLEYTNTGATFDRPIIRIIDSTAADWTILQPQTFFAQPGETIKITGFVKVPCKHEGKYTLKLLLDNTPQDAELEIPIYVTRTSNIEVSTVAAKINSCPCKNVQIPFTVKNTASFPDTFDITVEGNNGAKISYAPSRMLLFPGQSATGFAFMASQSCGFSGDIDITVTTKSRAAGFIAELPVHYTVEPCYNFNMTFPNSISSCLDGDTEMTFLLANDAYFANSFTVNARPSWAKVNNEPIELQPYQSAFVPVLLQPRTGMFGQQEGIHEILISARSTLGDTSAGAIVPVNVEACYGAEINAPPSYKVCLPENVTLNTVIASIPFDITNTGTTNATLDLALYGPSFTRLQFPQLSVATQASKSTRVDIIFETAQEVSLAVAQAHHDIRVDVSSNTSTVRTSKMSSIEFVSDSSCYAPQLETQAITLIRGGEQKVISVFPPPALQRATYYTVTLVDPQTPAVTFANDIVVEPKRVLVQPNGSSELVLWVSNASNMSVGTYQLALTFAANATSYQVPLTIIIKEPSNTNWLLWLLIILFIIIFIVIIIALLLLLKNSPRKSKDENADEKMSASEKKKAAKEIEQQEKQKEFERRELEKQLIEKQKEIDRKEQEKLEKKKERTVAASTKTKARKTTKTTVSDEESPWIPWVLLLVLLLLLIAIVYPTFSNNGTGTNTTNETNQTMNLTNITRPAINVTNITTNNRTNLTAVNQTTNQTNQTDVVAGPGIGKTIATWWQNFIAFLFGEGRTVPTKKNLTNATNMSIQTNVTTNITTNVSTNTNVSNTTMNATRNVSQTPNTQPTDLAQTSYLTQRDMDIIYLQSTIEALPRGLNDSVLYQVIESGKNKFINLSGFFQDPDQDALRYRALPTTNISIVILNQSATIVPDAGFIGVRYTVFFARDTSGDIAQTPIINIIVVPANLSAEVRRIRETFGNDEQIARLFDEQQTELAKNAYQRQMGLVAVSAIILVMALCLMIIVYRSLTTKPARKSKRK